LHEDWSKWRRSGTTEERENREEIVHEKYDVVMIGAGIGGLTCAATLVKGGKKVLICEQHSKPGGYVTSFTRNGFVFDGGTQSLSYGNIIFRILKDLEIWNKIKFVKVNYQIITPDMNLRLDSLPAYVSELKRLFPEDSRGIETLFRHLYGIIEDFE
jgi:all-trans-retinol 13,14-reductase